MIIHYLGKVPANFDTIFAEAGFLVEPVVLSSSSTNDPVLHEEIVYFNLLVAFLLFDAGKLELAVQQAKRSIAECKTINKRTLDCLQSRLYSILVLAHEKLGTLSECYPYVYRLFFSYL